MDAKTKISKAVMWMVEDDPFFAHIILSHKIIQDDSQPTMCINGKVIKFNTEFVEGKTDRQLGVILSHEAMHIALGHHLRSLPDLERMNIAGDLAINSHLCNRGGFPPDGIVPGLGDYSDMPVGSNMEKYYQLLACKPEDKPEEDKNPDPDNGDSGEGGQPEDNPKGNNGAPSDAPEGDKGGKGVTNPTPTPKKDVTDVSGTQNGGTGEQPKPPNGSGDSLGGFEPYPMEEGESPLQAGAEWQEMVASSAISAQEAGKLPGWAKELVDGILNPSQISWKRLLRPFLVKTIKSGNTYRRPNRRSVWRRDIVLPTRFSKGVEHVIFMVDTSMSMSQTAMNAGLTEIQSILKQFRDVKLTVMHVDTRVAFEKEFTGRDFPIDTSKWEWKGRGGTNFTEAMDRAKELRAQAVIVVTDGMFSFPSDTNIPTMWLMTTTRKAPWGQNVLMEV